MLKVSCDCAQAQITWLYILFSKYTYRSSYASSPALNILQILTSILQILKPLYLNIQIPKYSNTLVFEALPNMSFPNGSGIKNPPVVQKIQKLQFLSLGPEDPLEEEMATHCSVLSWRIPWTEELGGLWTLWLPRVRHNRAYGTSLPIYLCLPSLSISYPLLVWALQQENLFFLKIEWFWCS